MSKNDQQPRLHLVNKEHIEDVDNVFNDDYDDMERLERLESVREDMEDLGVTTLAEVIERIAELHRRLDEE